MSRLLRRALAFFQRRRADPEEGQQRQLPGTTWCGPLSAPQGASSRGRASSRVAGRGQLVNMCLGNGSPRLGLVYDHFGDSRPSEPEIQVLIGCVTSVMDGTVCLNKETSFCLDTVSEGFVPYKGDWLELTYSTEPGTAHIKAHSMKPVNPSRVDEVSISSINGRHGVIDDNIFFTLDSLHYPAGYVPQLHDVVDVVMAPVSHFVGEVQPTCRRTESSLKEGEGVSSRGQVQHSWAHLLPAHSVVNISGESTEEYSAPKTQSLLPVS
ncbi:cancer/testis antigen 55-like [Erethizon dorsatum]